MNPVQMSPKTPRWQRLVMVTLACLQVATTAGTFAVIDHTALGEMLTVSATVFGGSMTLCLAALTYLDR